MKPLQPEEIADRLWTRIEQEPGTAIYTLTWDDVVSVLANEMSNRGLPPEAFTDEELAALLAKGGDVELPWEETIEILLGWNWPELHLFEAHNTGQGEQAFYTTTLVWECECHEHYLHPRSQEQCLVCQVSRADAPDARMSEILARLDELPASLRTYIQHEWVAYTQPDVEILTQV